MKKSKEERLQRVLFAVSARGDVRPLFGSGQSVEAHIHEFDDVDWDDVVSGVPAEPGLYVWEGIPSPEYETDDYNGGRYIYTFTYNEKGWRKPDQIEWLAIMEGACPWASKREEKEQPDYINTFPIEELCPHNQLHDKKVTVCLECGETL